MRPKFEVWVICWLGMISGLIQQQRALTAAERSCMPSDNILIRPFQDSDEGPVQDLFVDVNRALAPLDLHEAFEGYIQRSLNEEMGRVADYYAEKGGGFWVAVSGDDLMGMFGLEPSEKGMELRRMYTHPNARRRGVARAMLARAEAETARMGASQLDLSTSELQPAALGLYRGAGYALVREEIAEAASKFKDAVKAPPRCG